VVKLEDGDAIPECIEEFAVEKELQRGLCFLLSGIRGGRLVAGAEEGKPGPSVTLEEIVNDVHEAAGIGTIFPDAEGVPRLHMHAALGRESSTRTGCLRAGTRVWSIGEAIIIELVGTDMKRRVDPATGLEVLWDM